jgi:hypothetical protein
VNIDISTAGNSEDKKSVLKRINQQRAWEDVKEGLVMQIPDNRFQPIRNKPESYAIALNGRRGLTLDAEPCPSCNEVHGKSSLQVDGEAERLPNPTELLLKIKRKHLRKRNLTDSVATYVKEYTPEGGAMTSRRASSGDKSSDSGNLSHRRAVTDTAHLEKLKEDVTLTLNLSTLTSANARMLGEDTLSATAAVKQRTPLSAAIPAKSDRLTPITHGQITEEKDELLLNKTYSLTNYDKFIQMAKIHKPEPHLAITKQYSKPLLTKRQVLALDFTKFESDSEVVSRPAKSDDTKTAAGTGDIPKYVSGDIGTLDTSMTNIMNDIPKCNRLPPISPVSKNGSVKVKVMPRSRSKKQGSSHLKEYDIKSIKRVEDLPPIVREELKNKARLRLKQLSSPIQNKVIERDH